MSLEMETKIKISAGFLILVLMSLEVTAYNAEGGGICNCSGCDDCENALNDNTNCYNLVRLTTDIDNHPGTCIDNPANFNNKIFDCQGFMIDGTTASSSKGVYLYKRQDNTIKNCKITDFVYGIALHSSSNTLVLNNSIAKDEGDIWSYGIYSFNQNEVSIKNCNIENYDYGIYLFLTSNSTIINNTVRSNMYGIYMESLDSNELKFLDIINEYRQNNSVSPLSLSSSLTRSAKGHSQDMANHNYTSHTSLDGRSLVDRARDAEYDLTPPWSISENIADR